MKRTKVTGFRLTEKEKEALNKIAEKLNYIYNDKPCFTKVLRDIASGELIILKKIT